MMRVSAHEAQHDYGLGACAGLSNSAGASEFYSRICGSCLRGFRNVRAISAVCKAPKPGEYLQSII